MPVERDADGAYAAPRSACAPVFAAGGIVIVYPEGTRSTDGTVGRFASGAVKLGTDLKVPVVPVALLGTADVLPKNGSFQSVPGRGALRFPRTTVPTSRPHPAARRRRPWSAARRGGGAPAG